MAASPPADSALTAGYGHAQWLGLVRGGRAGIRRSGAASSRLAWLSTGPISGRSAWVPA